mgnify:CR=1 FL=1
MVLLGIFSPDVLQKNFVELLGRYLCLFTGVPEVVVDKICLVNCLVKYFLGVLLDIFIEQLLIALVLDHVTDSLVFEPQILVEVLCYHE